MGTASTTYVRPPGTHPADLLPCTAAQPALVVYGVSGLCMPRRRSAQASVQVLCEEAVQPRAGSLRAHWGLGPDGCVLSAAALNLRIRNLLRRYEARPPPLPPLAGSMRQACSMSAVPAQEDEAPRCGRQLSAHISVLRCFEETRTPFVQYAHQGRRLPGQHFTIVLRNMNELSSRQGAFNVSASV